MIPIIAKNAKKQLRSLSHDYWVNLNLQIKLDLRLFNAMERKTFRQYLECQKKKSML